MRNHGNWIFSLSQLGRFLAERAEEGGALILPETSAQKLLVSHGRVVGVRTGDKGRNRDGGELGNFEAGSDLVAKVTVLAEGRRATSPASRSTASACAATTRRYGSSA
jgi:electron-transferring-flavoprotein dehydrogenase